MVERGAMSSQAGTLLCQTRLWEHGGSHAVALPIQAAQCPTNQGFDFYLQGGAYFLKRKIIQEVPGKDRRKPRERLLGMALRILGIFLETKSTERRKPQYHIQEVLRQL